MRDHGCARPFFFAFRETKALADVIADTLRHYERKGLLPPTPRSANGYRVYRSEALDRVRMIRSALRLGFSIDELARVLRVRAAGGIPCQEVRDMAAAKLRDLREREKELTQMVSVLRKVIRDWDRRLQKNNGRPAHLLQALPHGASGGHLAPHFSSSRRRHSRREEKYEE